eukprot:4270043-Pleurochrysis_carterae.AAC.2
MGDGMESAHGERHDLASGLPEGSVPRSWDKPRSIKRHATHFLLASHFFCISSPLPSPSIFNHSPLIS